MRAKDGKGSQGRAGGPPLNEWQMRHREREEDEAAKASVRVQRAKQARRRLAEAEASLASKGWTPSPCNKQRTSLPSSARGTKSEEELAAMKIRN